MNVISKISMLFTIVMLFGHENSFSYDYQQPNFPNQYQQQNRAKGRPNQMDVAMEDYGSDEVRNLGELNLNDPDAPD